MQNHARNSKKKMLTVEILAGITKHSQSSYLLVEKKSVFRIQQELTLNVIRSGAQAKRENSQRFVRIDSTIILIRRLQSIKPIFLQYKEQACVFAFISVETEAGS